ncbi:MAG: thermonuclease family protein [Methanobrevibacter sp.]
MKSRTYKILMITVLLVVCVGLLTTVTAKYVGTGFSHDIPDDKYDGMTASEILDKYNDTTCHVEETAVCTKVVDGDTIYLDNGEKIRFADVNAPERGVKGYNASKNFVKKLCLDKEVSLDIDDEQPHDKYGRTVAVVIVDNKNLNEMMLKEGLVEVDQFPSEFNAYDWL